MDLMFLSLSGTLLELPEMNKPAATDDDKLTPLLLTTDPAAALPRSWPHPC